jgi:hypothetical protein
MEESLSSVANRAKGKVIGQHQAEKRLESQLMDLLNNLLTSTENNMCQIRCLLEEVDSCPLSEEQQLANQALTDILESHFRTKQGIQSFMEFLDTHTAEKESDVIRIMGY